MWTKPRDWNLATHQEIAKTCEGEQIGHEMCFLFPTTEEDFCERMDKRTETKAQLKTLQNLLEIMLVDHRYMFSSIWHSYCLFIPLVTFFFT